MNRVDIIQAVIDRKRKNNGKVTYLEVGVLAGDAFFRVKADYKIGVDPDFSFSRFKQFRYCFKNPTNIFNHYYEMTSDAFFEKHRDLLSEKGLDVVFLDGLHTYEQSLKDLRNSLTCLNEGGVILLHDCNPASETAAIPATSIQEVQKQNPSGFDGTWNGDVWKTIANLRTSHSDLNVFVLDCDFGVGVVTRGRPESMLEGDDESVNAMGYKELAVGRHHILNLKEPGYFRDFCDNFIR